MHVFGEVDNLGDCTSRAISTNVATCSEKINVAGLTLLIFKKAHLQGWPLVFGAHSGT